MSASPASGTLAQIETLQGRKAPMRRKLMFHGAFFAVLGMLAGAAQAETGLAAVYSHRLDGHKTASGKIYKPSGMTVAHKSLPFGTVVQITNKSNGNGSRSGTSRPRT